MKRSAYRIPGLSDLFPSTETASPAAINAGLKPGDIRSEAISIEAYEDLIINTDFASFTDCLNCCRNADPVHDIIIIDRRNPNAKIRISEPDAHVIDTPWESGAFPKDADVSAFLAAELPKVWVITTSRTGTISATIHEDAATADYPNNDNTETIPVSA